MRRPDETITIDLQSLRRWLNVIFFKEKVGKDDSLHTDPYKSKLKYKEFKKFPSLFGIPLVKYFRTRKVKLIYPAVRISGVKR